MELFKIIKGKDEKGEFFCGFKEKPIIKSDTLLSLLNSMPEGTYKPDLQFEKQRIKGVDYFPLDPADLEDYERIIYVKSRT